MPSWATAAVLITVVGAAAAQSCDPTVRCHLQRCNTAQCALGLQRRAHAVVRVWEAVVTFDSVLVLVGSVSRAG